MEWRGKQQLWGEFKSISDSRLPERQYLEEAANDPVICDLRYGQVYDSETGLYYNRFRYYDPDSCQYLTPDPIGMAGGLRPSSYVHNPMEWVDPLGLSRYPGVDFTGSSELFPVNNSQSNIVKIPMQGSRGRDFTQSFKAAGIARKDAKGYTWHHVDDFDPNTGYTTMQLVKREAHEATFPHGGSVSQYEKHFGVEYDSQEAILTSKENGWLKGAEPKSKPKKCCALNIK